jgi:hypothetical protein
VLLFSGLLDWATLGEPFQSIWLYFIVNLKWHVASAYGVDPFYWYLASELVFWLGAGPILIYAAILGWRSAPPVTASLLVAFLSFSAVAHKEVRFVYALFPCFLILVGIGTAQLLAARALKSGVDRWKVGLSSLAWCALSFTLGFLSPYRTMWNLGRGPLQAIETVNHDPQACGLALYPVASWAHTYGHAYLRPDIRMSAATTAAIAAQTPAANYVLDQSRLPNQQHAAPLHLRGYEQIGCWADLDSSEICVLRRAGGCAFNPATDELKPDPGPAVDLILHAHAVNGPHLFTDTN